MPDVEKTLDQVALWTGQPRDELQKAFELGKRRTKHFEEQILVSNISFELVAIVETHLLDWPGLRIAVRPKRSYAYGQTLAHILGYVARANKDELNNDPSLQLGDDVGKQGVEFVLERRLRGEKGLEEFEVDASGRVLSSTIISQPSMGEDLTLSISLPLQEAATKALEGKVGAIVAMNADTGRILAQVSLPSYDPNEFVVGISHTKWNELLENPLHPLQNRPIQSAYPPGSFSAGRVRLGLGKGRRRTLPRHFTAPASTSSGSVNFGAGKGGGMGRSTSGNPCANPATSIITLSVTGGCGHDQRLRHAMWFWNSDRH